MAADTLRIAAQKTGTFAWELAVIKDHGLAEKAGLDLEVTELASTDAGKIAMMGNSADIIVSDWLWVARERSLGSDLTFYPYSSTLGAVMVPQQSPIKSLTDLKGKKLGVAGGPLDKSWLLLQALAKQQSSLDLESNATILYGAPSLLFEKALQGESDATLNFWNFCADLEAHGFRRLIGMDEVEKGLGATAPVAMVGYVFHDRFAASHADVLKRFFAVTRQAMDILANSQDEWTKPRAAHRRERSGGSRHLSQALSRRSAAPACGGGGGGRRQALRRSRQSGRREARRLRQDARSGHLLQSSDGTVNC